MRPLSALLRAMRTWRAGSIDLKEADRLVAGGRSGPGAPGLDHLLDAVRAPATTGEITGEQAVVAALAAERRRAALSTRPKGSIRVQVPSSARRLVVTITTAVAVLGVTGTAVAARTGNLPAGVQQHAHRLFSALGVPAPGTGTTPSPTTSPSTTPTRTPTPTPTLSATPANPAALAWCAAWQTAEDGGKPMNGRDRRDLYAAAGGADNVAVYCARLTASASASASPTGTPATKTKPGAPSSRRATPSHPTPNATTPSHPGPKK